MPGQNAQESAGQICQIGLIGLGAMGRPMAQRLLAAGWPLGLWARRPEVCQPLLAAGAQYFASPAALAAASDVVLTIVTHGDDVQSLVEGPHGLAAGLRPDSLLVDMSTIAAEQAVALGAYLATRGIHFIDAPVSGGAQGAEAGTLAIMMGGEAPAVQRVKPIMQALGRTLVHVGPCGSGQIAKACNQMVMVAGIQALAEAFHLARSAGVDPARVAAALAGGSAASRVLEVFGARMLERRFADGVEARLHHKDFASLLASAKLRGQPLPLAACVAGQLSALMAQGGGRDDTASLLRVLELNPTP